jgi:hypothetical protein
MTVIPDEYGCLGEFAPVNRNLRISRIIEDEFRNSVRDYFGRSRFDHAAEARVFLRDGDCEIAIEHCLGVSTLKALRSSPEVWMSATLTSPSTTPC